MKGHREKRTEKERIIIEKDETERLIDEKKVTVTEESYSEDCNDCNCSCKKCWKDYRACLDFTYIGIRSCLISIRDCIYHCVGACCFPIKERCCNCCDDIDKDLNPYKNPNYNPYDYL